MPHSGACDHDHGGSASGGRRPLVTAIILLSVTLLAEIAGGLFSGSLALLADAGHVFMDLFALTVSLGATMLAALPATSRRTYGWHRAEILAALLNGLLLTILAIGLLRESVERISSPDKVLAGTMLAVAVLGLLVNVAIVRILHRSHGHDLNMKSAYLHVLGDLGASVGVVIGAIIIHFTGLYIVDSIISLVIGLVILVGACRLMLKAGHILLEGVPPHLSVRQVADVIREIDGVKDVHDLHVWTLCSHIVSMSCHVNLDWRSPEEHDRAVRAIAETLWHRCSIVHSTIQVDYEACSTDIITQDMEHR